MTGTSALPSIRGSLTYFKQGNRLQLDLRGLKQIPRVTVHTPLSSDLSSGIVCFEVDGISPEAVVEGLQKRKVIASVTPRGYEMHLARLAPSLLTSPPDVDTSLRAIREIV